MTLVQATPPRQAAAATPLPGASAAPGAFESVLRGVLGADDTTANPRPADDTARDETGPTQSAPTSAPAGTADNGTAIPSTGSSLRDALLGVEGMLSAEASPSTGSSDADVPAPRSETAQSATTPETPAPPVELAAASFHGAAVPGASSSPPAASPAAPPAPTPAGDAPLLVDPARASVPPSLPGHPQPEGQDPRPLAHAPGVPGQAAGSAPARLPTVRSAPELATELATQAATATDAPALRLTEAASVTLGRPVDAESHTVDPASTTAMPVAPAPAPVTPAPAATPVQQATAQPAPAQPLSSQLAQPLFTLAGARPGEHVMTLRVTPENLGPVTVRALITADDVRIELFSPSDSGRDALRQILSDLRRDLASGGLPATLDLSSKNSSGDRDTQTPAETAPRQNTHLRDAAPERESRLAPASSPTSVLDITV